MVYLLDTKNIDEKIKEAIRIAEEYIKKVAPTGEYKIRGIEPADLGLTDYQITTGTGGTATIGPLKVADNCIIVLVGFAPIDENLRYVTVYKGTEEIAKLHILVGLGSKALALVKPIRFEQGTEFKLEFVGAASATSITWPLGVVALPRTATKATK